MNGRVTEIRRESEEKEKEKNFLSIGSQLPGLGQADIRCQEFYPGLTHEQQEPEYFGHIICCLLR